MDYTHISSDRTVWLIVAAAVVVAWLLLRLLRSLFFVVKQQSAAIVQRFGKFARVAHPGLKLKIPLIEEISGHVSLRVAQLEVGVETKTEDNVFVHLTVSVQYLVKRERSSRLITSFRIRVRR